MAFIEVTCRYCQRSDRVRKQGVSKSGHQRYRCEHCQRTFQLDYSNTAYKPGVKEQILDMAMNGSGIRDTARVLKVNMNTVMSTIKKNRRP